MQVLNEVLTLPGSLHPLSTLHNLEGAIKPPAPLGRGLDFPTPPETMAGNRP